MTNKDLLPHIKEFNENVKWLRLNDRPKKEHDSMSPQTKTEIQNIKDNLAGLKKQQELHDERHEKMMAEHNAKHEAHMAEILKEIKDLPKPPYSKQDLDGKLNEKADKWVESAMANGIKTAITFLILGILGAVFIPKALAIIIN